MLSVKDPLTQLLYSAIRFVGRSEVHEALVYLGLLGQEELEVWLEETSAETGGSSNKMPKSLSKPVSYSGVVAKSMCSCDLPTATWPGASSCC